MSGYAKPESGRANDSRPIGTIEVLAQETERLRHGIPGKLGNLKSTNRGKVEHLVQERESAISTIWCGLQ